MAVYATKDKPIKGVTVLSRQDDPPNGTWKTIAEIRIEEAPVIVRAVNCHDDLLAALKDLVAKIDQVEIDTNLGDETDRVFAHWEFDEARAAIAKAEAK